jgi:hypothetical protein
MNHQSVVLIVERIDAMKIVAKVAGGCRLHNYHC